MQTSKKPSLPKVHDKKPGTKSYHGFTLVELIVVITILVILGTIGFISLGNYSSSARDSARVSDMTLITKSLDIAKIQMGILPTPSNGKNITYSGGITWIQGILGDSVVRMLPTLSKKPLDSRYNTEYTYSILANAKEYELAGVMENPVASVPVFNPSLFITPVFAATDTLVAYVKGTYNSQLTKVSNGSACVTIALPSIILGNIPVTNRLEDAGSGSLVLKGKENLPSSYQGKIANNTLTGSVVFRDYGMDPKVVISTVCTTPETLSDALQIATGLRDAYSGTILANDPKYTPVTQAKNVTELTEFGVGISNAVLGSHIDTSSNSTPSPVACTAGNYSATGNAPCTAASAGYYVSTTSAIAQTICAANTYQNLTAQTSCTACPVGTASPAGSTSSAQCIATCPSGYTYIAAEGKCYTALRGPVTFATAWNDCNIDGAQLANNANPAVVCPVTGGCTPITGSIKFIWIGDLSSVYGFRMDNSTSDNGGGCCYSPSNYPDAMMSVLAVNINDVVDGTHYYWCRK